MATNVKYLKENNLYDAHKHFMELSEAYQYFPEDLEEADDDMNQNPMDNQDPNGMGGDMGMPQDQNGMGGPQDPNGMGGDTGMPQDQNGMGGDMGMPQDDPNGMGDDMGMSQQGGLDTPPMGEIEDDVQKEDEPSDTIDIDDLTKAQEKLNVKQNHVGRDLVKVDNKIEKLIDTLTTLLHKVDDNNTEIEALKAEFEKRNPTQTEKLNLRSLDSYPFSVKPTDYWSKKALEGGYEVYADNDEPTTKEYVITNNDVDNPSDDIANTFFNIDDDDIQTLSKIFNI